MSGDCHIYAVHVNDIETFSANPALGLGRSLLRGLPACHFSEGWERLQAFLVGNLTGQGKQNSPFPCAGDGYEPGDLESPQLLNSIVVKAWHLELEPLTDSVLEKWCNFHAFAVIEAVHFRPPQFLSSRRLRHSRNDFSHAMGAENWTLEQAEEFECLALSLYELKRFVARAAMADHGLAFVLPIASDLPAEQGGSPS